MKSKRCHAGISNVIPRTDKKKLNQKGYGVNTTLKKLCTGRNTYLIDNINKIKEQHSNRSKLHLNKRGSNMPCSTFIPELSRISNWQPNECNAGFLVEECNSDKINVEQSVTDCKRVLKSLQCSNLNKSVFAHLKINSISKKFEFLSEYVRGNMNVLVASETKVDNSLLTFKLFSPPYRLDRDSKDSGIMLYKRGDIPLNLLATDKKSVEIFYVELNLRNEKYLLNGSYNNPHMDMITNHLTNNIK